MSRVTVSTKRNRVYVRKFDHEEAIARFAAGGVTVAQLAREYGVTGRAVKRVVDPVFRQHMDSRTAAWLMSGVCVDCGKEGVSRHLRNPDGPRCRDCASKAAATTVRAAELQCVVCRRWLPDDGFPRSKGLKARRGRHRQCSECTTKARRAYRAAHRVPCEGGCGKLVEGGGRTQSRGGADRPYLCPQCWQLARKENQVAIGNEFVVLVEQSKDVWEVLGRVNANNRRDALNLAFDGTPPDPKDRVVIVSGLSWKPGYPKAVQMFDLEVEE